MKSIHLSPFKQPISSFPCNLNINQLLNPSSYLISLILPIINIVTRHLSLIVFQTTQTIQTSFVQDLLI